MAAAPQPTVDTTPPGGPDGQPPERYRRRREQIASLATGTGSAPATIEYTDVEHGVWATVAATLEPLWDRHAAGGVLDARERLALPVDRIPQLAEVSERLCPLTGFAYRAVPGLVGVEEFFGGLAARTFASTQFVRWEGSPLYTPEPDVIHEVFGHGNCLACPEIADLHVLAGAAITRLEPGAARQFVADVFWFSVEFGVVMDGNEPKAYGTGLLSSPGELGWFADHAELRPLDLGEMGTLAYDIDHYQPVLFAGRSLTHVHDVVGEFLADVSEDSIAALSDPR